MKKEIERRKEGRVWWKGERRKQVRKGRVCKREGCEGNRREGREARM